MENKFRIRYCHKCGNIAPFSCDELWWCYKHVHGTVKPVEKKHIKTNEEIMEERLLFQKGKINQLENMYKKASELTKTIEIKDELNQVAIDSIMSELMSINQKAIILLDKINCS